MTNEVLAGIQIGAALSYIAVAFLLYRLLVQQKQAQIEFLKDQLDVAKSRTPDELVKALETRTNALLAELTRLREDKSTTEAELSKVVANLAEIRRTIEESKARINAISQRLSFPQSGFNGNLAAPRKPTQG